MTHRHQDRNHHNPWKVAFLSLIGLIVIGIVGLFVMIRFSGSDQVSTRAVNTNQDQTVAVTMNKAQLNNLSQYYLNKVQTQGNGHTKYHFEIADQGIVYGSIKLLGSTIDYSLAFTPQVLANGNVELHATKMALGKFPVPISFVLANIRRAYKLPKWVKLDPAKKVIQLDIVHMNGQHGVNYRAKTIDLNGQGKFVFQILLPNQSKAGD